MVYLSRNALQVKRKNIRYSAEIKMRRGGFEGEVGNPLSVPGDNELLVMDEAKSDNGPGTVT